MGIGTTTTSRRRAGRFAFVWLAFAMLGGCTGAATMPATPGASPADIGSRPPSSTPSPDRPAPTATVGPPVLRVVVLGDSIVMRGTGCGSACIHFDEAYGTFLEQAYGGRVEVDNLARPDARIADLRSALDDTQMQRAIAVADIVIVSIGYNDEPPRTEADAPCRRDPPPEGDEVRASLDAILAMSDACIEATTSYMAPKLGDVYATIATITGIRPQIRITLGVFDNLIGNPPFVEYPLPDATRRKVLGIWRAVKSAWNDRNCEIATLSGFVCVDLYHAFNGPAGDEPIEQYVVGDYVHLAAAGQDRLAQLLEKLDLSAINRGR